MRTAAVVEGQISADPGAGLWRAGIDPQTNLVFDGRLKALDEDVVTLGALDIHADLDLASGPHLDGVGRGDSPKTKTQDPLADYREIESPARCSNQVDGL